MAMDVLNDDEKEEDFNFDQMLAKAQEKAVKMKQQADEQIKSQLGTNQEQMNDDLSLTYDKISCINQQEKDQRLRHQQLVKDAYLQTLFQQSDKAFKRQRKQVQQQQFPDFYLGIDSVEGRGKSKQLKSEPKKFKIESWKFYQNPNRLRELAEIGERSMKQQQLDEFKALQLSGFRLWKLPDVRILIKAIGKYGEEDQFNIIEMMIKNTQKTVEQIQEYLPVFVKRKKELEEDNLLVGLNKAIIGYKTKENQIKFLANYCNKYKKLTLDQWPPIPRIQYVKQADANHSFTAMEDNYILRTTNEIGFGLWDQITGAMSFNMSLSNQENYLNMSMFLMSRSPIQISQRVTYLLKMLGVNIPKIESLQGSEVDEEVTEQKKKPKAVQKKSKPSGKGGASKSKLENKKQHLNVKDQKKQTKYTVFDQPSSGQEAQREEVEVGKVDSQKVNNSNGSINLRAKVNSKRKKK